MLNGWNPTLLLNGVSSHCSHSFIQLVSIEQLPCASDFQTLEIQQGTSKA